MKSLSKKFKREWAFFINPKTDKVQYNEKCGGCIYGCKQSFRVAVVSCPHFKKTEEVLLNEIYQ